MMDSPHEKDKDVLDRSIITLSPKLIVPDRNQRQKT